MLIKGIHQPGTLCIHALLASYVTLYNYRLLEGVEILANDINLPENEESILIELETIIINVQAININKENLLVFESFKNSSEQSTNTIFLPEELIKLVSNDTSIIPTLSLLVHQKESLFLRRNQNKLSVNSKIVSASLQHTNVEGLKDPVVITLNANVRNIYIYSTACLILLLFN